MSLTPMSVENIYRDLGVFRRPVELFLSDFNNYFQQTSPYSVWNDDNTYNIEIEVPGYSQDDLEINLENNILSVSGTRGESRRRSNVSYSFTIPRYVKMEEMSASLSNGILTISAPIDSHSRVRKIAVQTK